MMIPATMIRSAAPRTAIAISPGEYFVFLFGGAVGGWAGFFFFFFRLFFLDIRTIVSAAWNGACMPYVNTVDGRFVLCVPRHRG